MAVAPLPVVLSCRLVGVFPPSNVSVLSEASKEEDDDEEEEEEEVLRTALSVRLSTAAVCSTSARTDEPCQPTDVSLLSAPFTTLT